MIILALDLGTHCGWKIGDRQLSLSGTWSFGNSRFEGGGMRFVKFVKSLTELTERMRPDMVVYEEVRRHIGVDAAHTYGGFWSHLAAWCESQAVPYEGVPVATIKKHITGHGNAPKTDADKKKRNAKARAHNAKPGVRKRAEYTGLSVDAALRAKGLKPADDNEADAMALWDYAQQEFGK